MEVIFMYESRIKGMKKRIPTPKETAEISVQTESEKTEEQTQDLSHDDGSTEGDIEEDPKRTRSAGARLELSAFELINILPEKRPKTADNSILKAIEDDNISNFSRISTATKVNMF